MRQKELQRQHQMTVRKVMSKYGVLKQYDALVDIATDRLNQHGSDDAISMLLIAEAEGMENFADGIILTTPKDWEN